MNIDYAVKYNIDINSLDLLDQLPCHVYLYDLENNVVWVNQKQLYNLKKNLHPFSGKNINDILVADEAKVIVDNNLQVSSSLQSRIFNEFATFGCETKYYHSHKSPFFDRDGKLFGVVGISQDITDIIQGCGQVNVPVSDNLNNITATLERLSTIEWVPGKMVRECLERVHNYVYVILGVMPGSFYWFDKENKLLGCNTNQAKVFGKTNYIDLIGKSPHDMVPPEQAEVIIHNNNQVMRDGKEIEIIEEVSSSSGETLKMLSTKKPIFDKTGAVSGLVGVSVDVTELQRMQDELKIAVAKAESANNAKTDFLLNISHDIRTPCSGLLGFAKILRAEESDPDKCEKLGYIENSAEKLLAILNQLIDYVRNESSPVGSAKVLNLKDLIIGIKTVLEASLQKSNLYFDLVYPSDVTDYWSGDAVNLERILLNLITNALKFTAHGGVSVIVCKTKADSLQIDIKDTGCGIPEKDFAKIFDSFHRLTPSYAGNVEGMGLGLSLVKNTVDKLGGSIVVDSTVGAGSTFTLELPFAIAERAELLSENTSESNLSDVEKFYYKKNPSANKVLIIEDDMISRKINRIILEKNGFTVVDCATAEDAQNLTDKFDLIITDIGLPKMNGFDFSKYYRAQHGARDNTFIVGLSAHLGIDYLEQAKQSGMNKIITKPLTDEALLDL